MQAFFISYLLLMKCTKNLSYFESHGSFMHQETDCPESQLTSDTHPVISLFIVNNKLGTQRE